MPEAASGGLYCRYFDIFGNQQVGLKEIRRIILPSIPFTIRRMLVQYCITVSYRIYTLPPSAEKRSFVFTLSDPPFCVPFGPVTLRQSKAKMEPRGRGNDVIVESSWHETESRKGIRGSMMVHETLHQESNEQKQSRMLYSCHSFTPRATNSRRNQTCRHQRTRASKSRMKNHPAIV